MLGLIAASTFVLYRAAFYLGVALQYPIYIACGLIVPARDPARLARPDLVGAGADLGLPRRSRTRPSAAIAWPEIGMCLLLSVIYFAIALPCLWFFERLARDRATLRLA